MPREKQKRGRRAEEKSKKEVSKRKRDDAPEDFAPKRLKSGDEVEDAPMQEAPDYIPLDENYDNEQQPNNDMPFYGLLDTQEQEYFSQANEILELNQFQDAEERRLFVESVYREAKGKELKLACSQSCSRLVEKLISSSDIRQVRRLFDKFNGHFLHLVQHRFASHCCETLFVHAAPGVTQKTSKPKKNKEADEMEEDEEDEPQRTLAEMFMGVVEELEGNWGYLLTERFASHTIRVLLLVLAGEPVDVASNDSVVASRKKEKHGIPTAETQDDSTIAQKRNVPESFEETLKKIMKDMVSVLDDTYLRALATHPVGNPILQVLVYLELSHFGKSNAKEINSITRRLIPDENLNEGSESASFIKGLLYDPVGSRLLETIVRYMPGKLYKILYKNIIRERIGSLARNMTAGYVVLRALERLGKDDLQQAMESIIPEMPGLIERSRLVVPKMLIERCLVRGVNTEPLARALENSYDKDPATRLKQMLKLESTAQENGEESEEQQQQQGPTQTSAAEKLHGSLLAQAMLTVPGPLSQLVFSSLNSLSPELLLQIAKDPTASRVLQQALTQSTSTRQFRRPFTTRFYGHMEELALHSSGSHVIDTLWQGTKDLFFVKERLAQELSQHEMALRDSFVGRAVWRNWSMDLYKRRRGEWAAKAKGRDQQSEGNGTGQGERPKSKIELARARFAAKADDEAKKKEGGQKPVATKS
ncbi:RNA-binding RNA processing protein NOP9 [Aspergillus chevalieri]|uniref:Nucleolar protein 9 n=1 Tax=Aspergillus chevalieri TaxID=182096 RepID=A0A7R7ZLN9_ASPCH|nr:nucleolar protein 9 [Aspergillus chevalieri]BCR85626.1 nucleolar protein 9 [Aspergillus chevalieri]